MSLRNQQTLLDILTSHDVKVPASVYKLNKENDNSSSQIVSQPSTNAFHYLGIEKPLRHFYENGLLSDDLIKYDIKIGI